MKNNLIILLCLLTSLGFSQKKETEAVKLKKAKLIEMKLLSDFVAVVPKDFKTIRGEFVCKKEGKVISQEIKNDTINEVIRTTFTKIDVGSKLYLDLFVNDSKPVKENKSKAQTFVFLIVE